MIEVDREGQRLAFELAPRWTRHPEAGKGHYWALGLAPPEKVQMPAYDARLHFGPLAAVPAALRETGKLTDSRDLPLYATALLVSQPLHFGDYGGMPLKIVWAVMTIATIVVLVTGLYLWVVRIRRRRAARPAIRAAYAAAHR